MRLRQHEQGFTIIELMIATAVFSTILLLCTVGLINIGRTYYKGITSAKTQETARLIMEEVTQTLQFGGGNPQLGGGSVYCLGGKRYSYDLDKQITDSSSPGPNQSKHVLVSDDGHTCGSVPSLDLSLPIGVGSRELMAPNMRLAKFDIAVRPGNLYSVTVRVIFGDDDLLDATRQNCSSERHGTQFCSVSELSTTVQKRVQ